MISQCSIHECYGQMLFGGMARFKIHLVPSHPITKTAHITIWLLTTTKVTSLASQA